MKRALPILIVVVLLIVGVGGCSYNGMNRARVSVDNKWADLQSAYQRRADLIPNLVATVKGAAKFEQETYTNVALARAGQLKQAVNVSADQLDDAKIAEIQKANADAGNAMRSAINIAVESYPDLKATANFSGLQSQLEGTENRINVSRNDYNAEVSNYNLKVTSFPTNLIAGALGFKQREMFKAAPGSENAPKVDFQ